MGALSQNLFTMIVAMAITTTMAMPPMLRWALARVPMRKEEKERLEREEIEAKGFVPNLERLLLAVDHSPNGNFASRLAGLLAGQRGMPDHGAAAGGGRPEGGDKAKAKARAQETAGRAARNGEQERGADDQGDREGGRGGHPQGAAERGRAGGGRRDGAHLSMSRHEAVAEEAEKGYDLLFVGVENTRTKNGAFHRGRSTASRRRSMGRWRSSPRRALISSSPSKVR